MILEKKKALFLDRDGVINVDNGYVHQICDFIFIEKIFEIATYFQERGFLIVVITNQSGIARGYYAENDFLTLSEWMVLKFAEKGITIARVYYCPHHPDHGSVCTCRKPDIGMITDAAQDFNIDLSQSVLIGDQLTDISAGKSAGIPINILIDELSDDISIIMDKIKNAG